MRILRAAGGAVLILTAAVAVMALSGAGPAGAASSNISQSYNAEGSVANGSIVSLHPGLEGYLELADSGNADRLIGVAVDSDDSLLAIDPAVNKVQVATTGVAATLVSTVNGPIKSGDQIAVSPFRGIGMKAVPGSRVVGLAQSDFNGQSEGARRQEVTGKDGQKEQIELGYVKLSLDVGKLASSGSGTQTNGLQNIAKGITGRTISTLRIIISLVVVTVTLVALAMLIYASVYGSIISIGRNPLGKNAIYRALASVAGMALLMFGVAGLTVFLLLR